jgi:hypothetical protein
MSKFSKYPSFFLGNKKKNKKKICKDLAYLGVGNNLTKFAIISMPEIFLFFYFLKKGT